MSEPEQAPQPIQPQGRNTGRIVIIAVGVVLVSALGFFMYKYFDEKGKNVENIENIDGLTAEIDDLEKDLDNYQFDIENKDLEIEEKEQLLEEKQKELEDKTKRINQLLASNRISKSKAEELKGKVEQLEYYVKKYQTEIAELKTRVATLENEKEELSGNITNMKTEMRSIEMEKIDKEIKLKAASYLRAYAFKFFRVKRSGKEIQETEFRKGQLDEMRISFNIMENPAAEPGPVNLYVQIKEPGGKVIGNAGSFTVDETTMSSSAKTSLDYDRTTTNVSVKFTQPEDYDYQKGKHVVKVWCDDYEIASSSFTVK